MTVLPLRLPTASAMIAALLAAAIPARSGAAPRFDAPAIGLPLPGSGITSAALDLDGDGVPEILAGTTSRGLCVFRRLVTGDYVQVDSLTSPSHAAVLAVGPLDDGGTPDVILQSGTSSAIVRGVRNIGGTLVVSPTSIPMVGVTREASDLDGDGRIDVAVLTATHVLVHVTDGSAGFAPAVTWAHGFSSANSMCPADLDGDGDVDLVVGNSSRDTIAILRNDGVGGFADAVSELSGSPVVLGAFDGLPGPDGVFREEDGPGGAPQFVFRSGDGTGGFGIPAALPDGVPSSQVQAADMNNDGKLDIVGILSFGQFGYVEVALGGGDGTFQRGRLHGAGSGLSVRPFIADLDGDEDRDLVLGAPVGRAAQLFINRGDGEFGGPRFDTAPELRDVALADVDGDGDPDLLTLDELPGRLTVGRNAGNGAFAKEVGPFVGYRPLALVAARVDSDVHPDVLATDTGGRLRVLQNDGTGAFVPGAFVDFYGIAHQIPTGDLDGDGALDVVLPTSVDRLHVLKGDGAGGFSMEDTLHVPGGFVATAVLAEFDADGNLDLAYSTAHEVRVHHGLGNGDFSASPLMLPASSSQSISALTSGDADGDGDTDLLAGDIRGGVHVWRNEAGTLAPPVVLIPEDFLGRPVEQLRVQDLDEDGTPEVLVAPAWYRQAIGVLDGTGSGSPEPLRLFGGVYDMRTFDTGDVDGDGDVDLVGGGIGSTLTEAGAVWTFTNRQELVAGPSPPRTPGPQLVLAGAWPNPSDGALSVRYRLPSAGPVRVELVSVDGRRVAAVDRPPATHGEHVVRLVPDRRLAAGLYLVVVTQESVSAARKVVVLP